MGLTHLSGCAERVDAQAADERRPYERRLQWRRVTVDLL